MYLPVLELHLNLSLVVNRFFMTTGIQNALTDDCDCFVCVISTHGGEDPGYYVGDTEAPITKTEHYILNHKGAVWTRYIMDMFNDVHCKALKGKPRLFFIQVSETVHSQCDRLHILYFVISLLYNVSCRPDNSVENSSNITN
jgi:hypothetical protein